MILKGSVWVEICIQFVSCFLEIVLKKSKMLMNILSSFVFNCMWSQNSLWSHNIQKLSRLRTFKINEYRKYNMNQLYWWFLIQHNHQLPQNWDIILTLTMQNMHWKGKYVYSNTFSITHVQWHGSTPHEKSKRKSKRRLR